LVGLRPPDSTVTGVIVVTLSGGRMLREETYWNMPDVIEQLTAERAVAASSWGLTNRF
jgi:hypothetical protein